MPVNAIAGLYIQKAEETRVTRRRCPALLKIGDHAAQHLLDALRVLMIIAAIFAPSRPVAEPEGFQTRGDQRPAAADAVATERS